MAANHYELAFRLNYEIHKTKQYIRCNKIEYKTCFNPFFLATSILFQAPPTNFSPLNPIFPSKPVSSKKRFRFGACRGFLELGTRKDGILVKDEVDRKKPGRVVSVQGFGFGGSSSGVGGGGGGGDNGGTARILKNIALAVGLTYLSVTGQLGVVFDAVGYVLEALISIWLLTVIIVIVGVGALVWWAGRDMLQSTCLTCGNEFQVFKSTLDDEIQQCPFCSQPFTVVDDKFARDSVNESTSFRGFYPGSDQGGKEPSSSAVVDVEAQVKDAD